MQVLDHVRQHCHSLRELTIRGGNNKLSGSLSALIASKRDLRSLSAEQIPLTLDSILSLPPLHRLRATIVDASLTIPPSLLRDNLFSALRVFAVNINPSLSLNLLESFHASSLEFIYLNGCWSSPSLTRRHISALQKSPLLSHIDIVKNSAPVALDSINSDSLRNLFPLKNVTYLSIQSVWFIGLERQLLRDIGRTWSRLRVLDLLPRNGYSFTSHNPTQIPLQNILELTTSMCPLLEILALNIEASLDAGVDYLDGSHSQSQHLSQLLIDIRSEDANAPDCLLEIFPNLTRYPHSVNGSWPRRRVEIEFKKRGLVAIRTARLNRQRESEHPPILL